jgi:hypothetical protein
MYRGNFAASRKLAAIHYLQTAGWAALHRFHPGRSRLPPEYIQEAGESLIDLIFLLKYNGSTVFDGKMR